MKVSEDIKTHLKLFINYYNKRSLPFLVGSILDKNTDYNELLNNPTYKKLICSIYLNNLKINHQGEVLNHKVAMKRAAQQIRTSSDSHYIVEPKFKPWELELHPIA